MASPSVTEGGRPQDESAKLEWLKRALPFLRAAIRDGERRQIEDEVSVLWLQEMKDVACDAEDVMGGFEYEELRRQVEGHGGQTSESARSGQFDLQSMVQKIDEIQGRLEDIKNWRIGLMNPDGPPDPEQGGMTQTSSLLVDGEVVGREEEKEEIVEFLLAPNVEGALSTVAITGMGGLGKTTLAQVVYNDRRVQKHFDLKIWVCTTVDYDVVRLTKEILVSADPHPVQDFLDIKNLDVHQKRLMEVLEGKRFLLVIDNLWDRDHRMWQNLYAPLIDGKKGSKVLVTTRDREVSRILQAKKMVELQGLQFQDCWMLFKKRAFVDGNAGDNPRLEVISKQIVEKFKGVPLAAVTVGGLLHSKLEEDEWIRILESKVWEERGEDGILSVLKLSYNYLPPQLKQCYAYCSLFPKDHKFDKLELVQQWMAQGFISTGGRERMEDVGTDYFNDLFNRSFFQFVDGKFVMHDLIHDLAEFVSQHDHAIMDVDGSYEIREDARKLRHVSLLMPRGQSNQRTLEALCRYRGLRTLASYFPRNCKFQIPHNLFLSLNTLRVLDLSWGNIDELPDSIGHLKHLQYLDLRGNTFRRLPESLCCLYKLQTLKLTDCSKINKLPQGISNLISLRHLEVGPFLLSGVIGIGKLTCLQELKEFPVSEGYGIKIEDLKHMNELRGTLSIENLGRVTSKEESMRAMLNNKRYLHRLEINWWGWWMPKILRLKNRKREEVLEGLVPPPNLKELSIKDYDGVKYPTWMEQQSISKLESLSLSNCTNLNSLPSFPTTIREIIIKNVGLEELPDFNQPFSKLESLCLSDCTNLNSLPVLWRLSFLKTIEIVDCPHLVDLPSFPTTIREITINNVGLEELPDFYQPVSGSCNNISPSLSVLRIRRCPALKSFQQGPLRHHLRNLSVLSIQDCVQLVHWPEGAQFQATLLSLQGELYLEDCPKLMAFPPGSTLSTSLQAFKVKGCPGVPNELLFAQLHNLSSGSMVHVEKGYANLACCYEEALKNMRTVDLLVIDNVVDDNCLIWYRYLKEKQKNMRTVDLSVIDNVVDDNYLISDLYQECQISLVCKKQRIWSWRHDDWVLAWQVRIDIGMNWGDVVFESCGLLKSPFIKPETWWERRSQPATGRRAVVHKDDHHHHNSLFSACLGEQHWASSLRWLQVANGTLNGAFLSSNLASLEGLWISHCRGTRPLLTDDLLTRFTGLMELQIFDCQEMTLSSLQEIIQSLPSLQHLTIEACPNLSSSSSCSSTSSSPADILQPTVATLQTLFVDDATLLGNTRFLHDHLSSLRGLHIWEGHLTFFTAAMEDRLRSLGQSLQHLSFKSCPNLEHLPSDLRILLPVLKALSIGDCPKLQCLPTGGLPTQLEVLVIHGCSRLKGRCKPPPPPGQEVQQETDWPKIAHFFEVVDNPPGQEAQQEIDWPKISHFCELVDNPPGQEVQQETDWSKIAHIPVVVNNGELEKGSYREFLELRAKWRDF